MENHIARRLDAVVVPTTLIRQRFEALGVRVAEVRNYPRLEHFGEPGPWETRSAEIATWGPSAVPVAWCPWSAPWRPWTCP